MKHALLVTVVAFAGCSDDVDLTGTYMVTREASSSPCGVDAPITDGKPIIRFEKQSLLGSDFFQFERCDDAAGTGCSSAGLFAALSIPTDRGWDGQTSSSSGSGGRCVLSFRASQVTLEGDHLVFEETARDGELMIPDAACEPETAEARQDELACSEHTVLEADRI